MKKNPAQNTIDTKLGNILARKTDRMPCVRSQKLNEIGNTIGNFIEMLENEALLFFIRTAYMKTSKFTMEKYGFNSISMMGHFDHRILSSPLHHWH